MISIRDIEYSSVAAIRKRSLSCYIRNEDSPLKTKTGEKKEREGKKGERERETRARWDSLRGLFCGASRGDAASMSVWARDGQDDIAGATGGKGVEIQRRSECGPRIAVISNFTGESAQLMN